MKNKIADLNNHLFTQLERLNDEDISSDDLDKEIKRADAIVKVATQIIDSSNLSLRAASLVAEYGGNSDQLVSIILGDVNGNGKKQIVSKTK